METQIGSLNFLPIKNYPELLANPVRTALLNMQSEEVKVSEIDSEISDTAAFCDFYNINLNQAANCVILEAKRGERIWYAACVVLGNTRADVNGLARKTLDARRVSFAAMQTAVELTGMEYGAITPVGLPKDWPILVDKAVFNSERVIVGSGFRKSKLLIPGMFLSTLPNTKLLEGLGKIRE